MLQTSLGAIPTPPPAPHPQPDEIAIGADDSLEADDVE